MKRAIAYIRVSTLGQEDGQGFDLQLSRIREYAPLRGYRITKVLREVHTGRGKNSINDRIELQRAIALARKMKWPIMVAGLDRLSRNTHSATKLLKDPDVLIISVDDGEGADEALLTSQAAHAERVGDLISKTTKKALKVLKSKGQKLGNRKNLSKAQKLGAESNKRRARLTLEDYAPIIARIDQDGDLTHKEVADALNKLGRLSPRGKPWTAGNVRRMRDGAQTINVRQRQQMDSLWGRFP